MLILHTSSPDVDITIFSVGFPDFVPNFWNEIKSKSVQLHTTKTNVHKKLDPKVKWGSIKKYIPQFSVQHSFR